MKAKDSFSVLGFHVLTAIKCDNSTIFKLLHIDLPLCSRILDLCFTTHGRHHCSHGWRVWTCPSSQGQCQEFTPGLPAPKLGFSNHSSVYISQLGEDLGFRWTSQSNHHILLSHCLLKPGLVCLLMPACSWSHRTLKEFVCYHMGLACRSLWFKYCVILF